MLDIELLQLCGRADIDDLKIFINKSNEIIQINNEWNTNYINNLPIKTFYVTVTN